MARIGFFFADFTYSNPTYRCLRQELVRNGDASLVLIDVSRCSADGVASQLAELSSIVIDNSVRFATEWNPKSDPWEWIPSWRGSEHYQRILELLLCFSGPKTFNFGPWDLHCTWQKLLPILAECSAVVWPAENHQIAKEDIPEHELEYWMKREQCPLLNWSFIRRTFSSRLEQPHALVPNEVCTTVPSSYRWDLSICGARYYHRRLYLDQVASKANVRIAPYDRIDHKLLRVLERLCRIPYGSVLAHKMILPLRSYNQHRCLSGSAVSFTCGSGYCYAVRRFFEIPAAGSVMIAHPATDLKNYGFVEGEHYIAVDWSAPLEQFQSVLADARRRQEIATNARNLLMDRHLVTHRADALATFLKRVDEGQSVVGSFSNGSVVFRDGAKDVEAMEMSVPTEERTTSAEHVTI